MKYDVIKNRCVLQKKHNTESGIIFIMLRFHFWELSIFFFGKIWKYNFHYHLRRVSLEFTCELVVCHLFTHNPVMSKGYELWESNLFFSSEWLFACGFNKHNFHISFYNKLNSEIKCRNEAKSQQQLSFFIHTHIFIISIFIHDFWEYFFSQLRLFFACYFYAESAKWIIFQE